MSERIRNKSLDCDSDNLKSKTCTEPSRSIQNPKWAWLTALVFTFALCGAVAEAQQQTILAKNGAPTTMSAFTDGVGQNLQLDVRSRDYTDGKNRILDTRSADNKPDSLQARADELVRMKLDVLVASSTAKALAFKKATSTIPIVFIVSTDPVADGLVESLARPGGNITGVTTNVTALAGKRLALLKEFVPKLTRVAVLWNPQDPTSGQNWRESRLAAQELGLQLRSMEVSSLDKLEVAFKEAVKAGSAALAVMPSPLVSAHPRLIADMARRHWLPSIFDQREFVANGGLISYGADPTEPYRHAALIVDKILKGAKPADIPVEQPTKFELVVNLTAAKQINLTIPPALLSRAEKISQ